MTAWIGLPRVLWAGQVPLLAWLTRLRCLEKIQNRGFKPGTMGDFSPAKAACSLGPHQTEGWWREQFPQRDGAVSEVLGPHGIGIVTCRTPELVSCSSCGVCTKPRPGAAHTARQPGARRLRSSQGASRGAPSCCERETLKLIL